MKIIAFYLPQFHTFPENDKWWGKGFTEWTNTKKTIPLFKKHNQPREPLNDNYYDLLDEKAMIWQSKIAKKYGIYGFCYYHYWFKNGKKLMEKPLEKMLKNKKININFCLSWANEPWTRRWDGLEKEVLMPQEYGGKEEWKQHFDYLCDFFDDDRYIKEDNKPIFIIYRPELIPKLKEMLFYWNNLAKNKGFDGIKFVYQFPKLYYIQSKDRKLFSNGIKFEPIFSDNSIEYSMLTKNQKIKYLLKNKDYLLEKINLKINKCIHKKYPNVFNYDRIWKNILNSNIVDDFYPGAFVDWDNSARRGYDANIYHGATPDKFKKYMKKLIKKAKEEYKKDIIFINAWNEWAEGAYLEPDKKNGYKYLETIKEVLDEENG